MTVCAADTVVPVDRTNQYNPMMATHSAQGADNTQDEESSKVDDVQKPDRSSWPTRLRRLSEGKDDADILAMTPGERIEMMWPLAVDAWAMMGVDVSNARMERHIVRIIRGGKSQSERRVDQ